MSPRGAEDQTWPTGTIERMVKPWWKRWYVWAAVVVAIALIGGLTGQLDSPQPTPTPTVTKQPPAPTAEAPTPSACEQVPPAKVADILGGSKSGTLTPVKAAAVRSEQGNYFIAIRLTHDTGEDTGVWQSPSLDNAMIGSVNAIAKAYTRWPDTGNAGAKAHTEAEACIK